MATSCRTFIKASGAAGLGNKRIAELCGVSVNTVQTHVQNCYRKLDVPTLQELMDKLMPADHAETR